MGLFSPDIYELQSQAKQLAANGKDSEAIKLYRKLIKLDPDFTNLYAYYLGNLYGYDGPCRDDEEALFWYAKVTPNTVSKEKYCDVLRYQGNINRWLGRPQKALSFYEEADRQEDPVTQNLLGILYEQGDGFAQNTDTAIHYYKRAIQNGSADAMVNLSDIYKKSPDTLYEAITLLEKACSQNQPDAQGRLNQVFSDTSTENLRTLCRSMPEDKKYGDEHFRYLSERARRNDSSCFYTYGKALKKRDMIPEAIEAFKKSPTRKTGDAYYELGLLTQGEESADFFEKCIQYGLEHAVTTTTQKAMTKLALHHKELGQTEKAISYNEMAISHGYSLGYLRLGEIYREQRSEAAEDHFLKAYNAGWKKAAMYLYEYACARKDYTAAKKWCDETPQKEGNKKLYRLALLTWHGQGTKQDEEKAVSLLKQAIETKDCPEEMSKPLLLSFYAQKQETDYDTFQKAYQLYLELKEDRFALLVPQAELYKLYSALQDRAEKYLLPENPSDLDHLTLAGHYLNGEILAPNVYHALRHIVEGLGYSWDSAASLYAPPQYPEALELQFHCALDWEMSGASRYQLIKLYRPLAEQGHIESMYQLFNQLIKVTKYGTPEYKEVSKWLDKATKSGHPCLQKSLDPLIGFIVQSALAASDFTYATLLYTEAIHCLARRCEEIGDDKHLTAAKLLYLTVVKQYEDKIPALIKLNDHTFGRTSGYRYYRIYNLYCTSLIKDEAQAQKWLEKMCGYNYPPADFVWLREHNPLPLCEYEFESRQTLRKKYQEILAWGELQAEEYL